MSLTTPLFRYLIGTTILIMLTVGCASTGIRGLTEVETKYFNKLQGEIDSSSSRMQGLLEKNTGVIEEAALKEIARLDNEIRRAKLVYSIREVLKAPEGDRAEFIQVTRNKIVIYYLAQASQAENEQLNAQLELGRQKRRSLIAAHQSLTGLVNSAIESNKVLYNHLNKSVTAQLSDVVAEVGRQTNAFNEEIKKADQDNPVIQQLVKAGENADRRLEQADKSLTQFIGIWGKLNGGKE